MPQDLRRPSYRAMPLSHLSSIVDAAAAHARDARRSMAKAAPSLSTTPVADPGDVVARALAVLAEENMLAEETRSVDLPLQWRVLSDGTPCPLPIRYFDVQCLVATFLTDLDQAAGLLKGTGLKAVPQEDGKAVVELYCIEYRKTDIGPYNEVGLAILAVAPADPIPAIYVTNLPVTTALANRAGQEIWGYNKFVAAIDVKREGKKFSTLLRDLDNATICALEGRFGASAPVPPSSILTFTLLKGRVIKTLIQVLTPFQAGSGDGFVFKVGTSRHPMTNNLRILALDGAHPVQVKYADPFQALLFPGRAL